MPSWQQTVVACYLEVTASDGDLFEAGPSSSSALGTHSAVRFSVAASSSAVPVTCAVSSAASLEPLLAVVLSGEL